MARVKSGKISLEKGEIAINTINKVDIKVCLK